ncbi:ThiF family adenylyltransferase [Jeotgalibacillus sp. ET6]|uniref:ThiF family adenylyltransferase n=1 Tax=Jeotgalibacillus sp. ET6 TaxID=3037260 RepID=UPI0024186E64|nr:ThiF family adenylyltransferase [Jeotgalibacillus sp. ET6]MDG5471891.1 ThiF family adenylyltransferase [Jeotgalibacillus sp. ET6]
MTDDRYSRQELFRPIGEEGQQLIKKKHVLLVGAGALGTGNAESLVRAGVGKLTIVDRDYVETSNLQRQQLYSELDAQKKLPKAIAAKYRLEQINHAVKIEAHVLDAAWTDLLELAGETDLILDATDNYETRLMLNDVSHKLGIPWIYGACVGSSGMTFTIIPGETPCFQCLWNKMPTAGGQTCDTAGIISPAVGMVVSYQTADALKILVEDKESLSGKLITFDLWQNTHTAIQVRKLKSSSCPTCGTEPTYPYLSAEHTMKTAVLCGRDTVQIRPAVKKNLHLPDLNAIFTTQGLPVQYNHFLLSVEMNEKRMVVFEDGRVLIHGTNDVAEAKKMYHRIFS